MKSIVKGREPKKLKEYRRKPNATYDGTPEFTGVKDKIKAQLLKEQGYLCAYCMSRISSDFGKMKVEHWHCQDNYKNEQLDYPNMLGVCNGNEGNPPENQTCDTRRGYFHEKNKRIINTDLKYNPANPNHRIEDQIHFLAGGKINSQDGEFNSQLNEMLNLNFSRLEDNRRKVWNEVQDTLSKKFSKKLGTRTPNEKAIEINKLLEKWSSKDRQGQFRPYCSVAIYFLKKVKMKLNK